MKDLTPRQLWLLWVSLLLVSTTAGGWTFWRSDSMAREVANVRNRIEQFPSAQVSVSTPATSADFTTQLGPARSTSRFVAELQRASASAGVSVSSLTVNERAPAADALGRQEFSINLRGAYGPTKRVLAEVLGRFSAASISVLRMRRDAASGLVETAVVFSVWSAPLAVPASGVR
jgi:hypothetical protein